MRKQPLQTKLAVTDLPCLSPLLLESLLSPGAASKTWEETEADPPAHMRGHGISHDPQGLCRERGCMGKNMHGGYLFSKVHAWKDFPLYWTKVLIKLMGVPACGSPRCLLENFLTVQENLLFTSLESLLV